MFLRPVIIIVLGFAILFGISITTSYQITNSSEVLKVELMATEELIHSEQWEQAQLRIEELQTRWSEYHNWWAIFLNHSTLSSIEISLSRLQQFTLTKNEALSLAELHTLLVLLNDASESELLKIYNIF